MANVNSEVDYMKKFMGVFHVASPVQPLSSIGFSAKQIRTNQDKVITASEVFSHYFIQPEFQIYPASITHEVTTRILPDPSPDISGHLFFDTYLSPNVYVRPVGTSATPVKMSDVFTETLSDLATELDDNCIQPNITSTINYLVVDFDFSTNGNQDLSGLTYSWSFGDGQKSFIKAPTITFAVDGIYAVVLTITYPSGVMVTAHSWVSVAHKPFYHYELWTTCQWIARNHNCSYLACPPELKDDSSLVNTGLEWNFIYKLNESNGRVGSWYGGEADSNNASVLSFTDGKTTFSYYVDKLQKIYINTALRENLFKKSNAYQYKEVPDPLADGDVSNCNKNSQTYLLKLIENYQEHRKFN